MGIFVNSICENNMKYTVPYSFVLCGACSVMLSCSNTKADCPLISYMTTDGLKQYLKVVDDVAKDGNDRFVTLRPRGNVNQVMALTPAVFSQAKHICEQCRIKSTIENQK